MIDGGNNLRAIIVKMQSKIRVYWPLFEYLPGRKSLYYEAMKQFVTRALHRQAWLTCLMQGGQGVSKLAKWVQKVKIYKQCLSK